MKLTKKLLTTALALSLGLVTATANATLISRLGGLAVYDTDLNITWLADTSYAKTSGYDADGMMTWSAANAWASGLTVGGFSGWRLPTALPYDPSCANQNGGLYSTGYNCTGSEMGHLFYNEMGASGGTPISLGYTNYSSFSLFSNDASGFTLIGPVDASYWTGTDAAAQGDASKAWDFSFYSGDTYAHPKVFGYFAMAVRPGDVAAVPVPAAAWLLGSGLLGLIGVARRKA